MSNSQKIFTPVEAADYLTKLVGRRITVARLGQLRRDGKVKGTTRYNTTIYTQDDLEAAAPAIKLGNSANGQSDDDTSASLGGRRKSLVA